MRCTMESISQTLALCMQDFRKAKKNESRQEKKAMKAEVKALMKEMKHNFKRTWKARS